MQTNIEPIKAYEVALYFLYRARELWSWRYYI